MTKLHIVTSIKTDDQLSRFVDKIANHGEAFITDAQMYVRAWHDSIKLTDMTHAMKRGQDVFTITLDQRFGSDCDALNTFAKLMRDADCDIRTVFAKLEAMHNETIGDVTVYVSERKATKVWHPTEFRQRTKPLKAVPKKWTMPLTIRALIHNQAYDVRCDSRYTDDYAFDAAYNYGKGNRDALAFAQDLYSNTSGWRVYPVSENRISVNCHSFNNNSFSFSLDGKARDAWLAEVEAGRIAEQQTIDRDTATKLAMAQAAERSAKRKLTELEYQSATCHKQARTDGRIAVESVTIVWSESNFPQSVGIEGVAGRLSKAETAIAGMYAIAKAEDRYGYKTEILITFEDGSTYNARMDVGSQNETIAEHVESFIRVSTGDHQPSWLDDAKYANLIAIQERHNPGACDEYRNLRDNYVLQDSWVPVSTPIPTSNVVEISTRLQ